MCMALCLLKQADREEEGFYQQYRRQRMTRARAALSDDLWRCTVYHPDQRSSLGAIFALRAPALAPRTARPVAHFGLKPRDRREAAHDQLPFVRVLDYATSVIRVARPELYLQPHRSVGLVAAHTHQVPTLVAGAPLLQSTNEKELAFVIGKQLAHLRPEHLLRSAFPSRGQLQTALLAAVKLFQPALAIPDARTRTLAALVQRIDRVLQPAAREQLAKSVQRLCGDSASPSETISRWWNAIDMTADRVGLILCNDLEIAARAIAGDARQADLAPADRLVELLRFASSEAYLALRTQLGITIDR
jgi:hypothetical protein